MATIFSTPRRYSRVACHAAATVSFGGATVLGTCENLSLGGAFFRGAAPPLSGSVTMTLCLPSVGPVEMSGEVCHGDQAGCGIRFTRLPSQALAAICAYVGASARLAVSFEMPALAR